MPDHSPALAARNHALFWAAAFGLFLLAVWLLADMLLPFVLGLAIAYLLNPLVEFLGQHKVPRGLAALTILGLFFAFVLTVLALAVPPLYREAGQLAAAMPGYIDRASELLTPYIGWLQEKIGNGDLESYRAALQDHIGKALKVGAGVLGGIASGGQAFAGFVSFTVLTPIIAFFMMKEWKTMTGWVDGLLPRGSYATIKDIQRQIDRKIAGFVRGQLSVAFSLAVLYGLALTFAGLNFGFIIGFAAGVLAIIPYVSSPFGLIVGLTTAWFQTGGDIGYLAIIAGIFGAGQVVETYILTPKLLGESVGLHPLWILFALLAGGSLFGLVGLLLGVPVAAVIGVLLAFAIGRYKQSAYYGGSVSQ